MPRADRHGVTGLLARRAFADARVRTICFAYLFAIYAWIQPVGYRRAYPDEAGRIAFAASFGNNAALRLLYGQPHNLLTITGYCAWRVGGVLAIAAAAFGLLAAVRALRTEEDSGRTDVVLATAVSRRTVRLAAALAVAAGVLLLWAAEFAGFLVGGLPAGGSAYLALAGVSVAPVFAGVGAVASQLAATHRAALGLGSVALAVLFLLRVVADTVDGFGWLRWATPLGWAEQLRPFADPRPVVLLLPAAAAAALLAVAARLASRRDLGTGVLAVRDEAQPRLALLRSPLTQALRADRGPLAVWLGAVAVFFLILGVASHGISSADIPPNIQKEIEKFGAGSITTPSGYLAFVFIFVIVVVSAFGCAQVGAARQEELQQYLDTLLAQPVGRARWLGGRLLLAAAGAAAVALAAGSCAWLGALGSDVSLPRMLEAAANCMPTAVLFLGVAALAYAVVPRAGTAVAYGLLTVAFLWQLVGSLLSPPRWVLDLTPFAHVGLVPAQPFHALSAVVMTGIGLLAVLAALAVFGRRDLSGA